MNPRKVTRLDERTAVGEGERGWVEQGVSEGEAAHLGWARRFVSSWGRGWFHSFAGSGLKDHCTITRTLTCYTDYQ
jgi:hypothetical protein